MITRRTSERRYFLKPDPRVKEIVEYVAAHCAVKHSIKLIAIVVLSNHYHLILEDPHGVLPDFMRDFGQLLARSLNAHYGRGENLWAPGSYNRVEILDEESLIEKLLYVWSNAVKDGLIGRPEDWPGLRTLPEDMGKAGVLAMRPKSAFFGGRWPPGWKPTYERRPRHQKPKGRYPRTIQTARARYREKPSKLPEAARLRLDVPTVFLERSAQFVQAARAALDAHLEEIYQLREQAGLKGFLGVEKILAQDPLRAAGHTIPDFGLDPTLSSKDTATRVAAIQELQEWRATYKAALARWREGQRDTRFPRGTWGMRQIHDVLLVGEEPRPPRARSGTAPPDSRS